MGTEITPLQEVKNTLAKMSPEFSKVLPPQIKPEKFAQVAVTALQLNSNLLKLDRNTLYSALLQCASDGLIPDGREAAIVPFSGKAKYMPMVQGITKKARNSGEIASMDAVVVYESDVYSSYVDEKGQHFKHEKNYKNRGKPILTYAYAITKDGGLYFEEIDEAQMGAIRKCCRASDTPWNGPFEDEMRRKSALRRLCKYRLPSSADLEKVITQDDDMYDLNNNNEETIPPANEVTPPPVENTTSQALHDAVTKKEKENVTDAEIVPSPSEDAVKKITGFIEELKIQAVSGKNKFGCRLKDKWYSNFDKEAHKIMAVAADNKRLITIEFKERKNDKGMVLNDIVKIYETTLDDAKKQGVVKDEEVPI